MGPQASKVERHNRDFPWNMYIRHSASAAKSEFELAVSASTNPAANALNAQLLTHMSTAGSLKMLVRNPVGLDNDSFGHLGAHDHADQAVKIHDKHFCHVYYPAPGVSTHLKYGAPSGGLRLATTTGGLVSLQWYQTCFTKDGTVLVESRGGGDRSDAFLRMEFCCAVGVLGTEPGHTPTEGIAWTQTLWRDYLTASFVLLDLGIAEGHSAVTKNLPYELSVVTAPRIHAVANVQANSLVRVRSPQYAVYDNSDALAEPLRKMQADVKPTVEGKEAFWIQIWTLLCSYRFSPSGLGRGVLERLSKLPFSTSINLDEDVCLVHFPKPSAVHWTNAQFGHGWCLGTKGSTEVSSLYDATRDPTHPAALFRVTSLETPLKSGGSCTFTHSTTKAPVLIDGFELSDVKMSLPSSFESGTDVRVGCPVSIVRDDNSGGKTVSYSLSTKLVSNLPVATWEKVPEGTKINDPSLCTWAVFGAARTPVEAPKPTQSDPIYAQSADKVNRSATTTTTAATTTTTTTTTAAADAAADIATGGAPRPVAPAAKPDRTIIIAIAVVVAVLVLVGVAAYAATRPKVPQRYEF